MKKIQILSNDEKEAVIEAVGIGAVKYADLSKNRNYWLRFWLG